MDMRYQRYQYSVKIERNHDAFNWCYNKNGPCAVIDKQGVWDIAYFFDSNSQEHYNTYYFLTRDPYVEFVLTWT